MSNVGEEKAKARERDTKHFSLFRMPGRKKKGEHCAVPLLSSARLTVSNLSFPYLFRWIKPFEIWITSGGEMRSRADIFERRNRFCLPARLRVGWKSGRTCSSLSHFFKTRKSFWTHWLNERSLILGYWHSRSVLSASFASITRARWKLLKNSILT